MEEKHIDNINHIFLKRCWSEQIVWWIKETKLAVKTKAIWSVHKRMFQISVQGLYLRDLNKHKWKISRCCFCALFVQYSCQFLAFLSWKTSQKWPMFSAYNSIICPIFNGFVKFSIRTEYLKHLITDHQLPSRSQCVLSDPSQNQTLQQQWKQPFCQIDSSKWHTHATDTQRD